MRVHACMTPLPSQIYITALGRFGGALKYKLVAPAWVDSFQMLLSAVRSFYLFFISNVEIYFSLSD
jgi:hypothetical protein